MSEKSTIGSMPWREDVERQRDQVDVAGALAVAEQAALDALRSREHGELGAGDAGAAVVVRVDREDHRVAPVERAVHVLDLVGVDVGRRELHRGRQVVDHRAVGSRVPQRRHRVADLEHVVRLGQVEHLGRELEPDVRVRVAVGAAQHVLAGGA